MFENIGHFFKRIVKTEQQKELGSKDAAKERLHLVLMQDRANVSADFLELMKQEIIDVIKKYIVVDEAAIDVRLTNQSNEDGTNGAPALYANIPIVNIKNDMMAEKIKDFNKEMGITVPNQSEEEPKEEKIETPEVIELSDSYEETKENENLNQEETNSEVKEENNEEIKEENDSSEEINNDNESEESEEPVELFEEVDEDEDDDDVTFDDLLKAAEEEDKNLENVQENNNSNNNNNYSKGGKKNHKKSKDKRNRKN